MNRSIVRAAVERKPQIDPEIRPQLEASKLTSAIRVMTLLLESKMPDKLARFATYMARFHGAEMGIQQSIELASHRVGIGVSTGRRYIARLKEWRIFVPVRKVCALNGRGHRVVYEINLDALTAYNAAQISSGTSREKPTSLAGETLESAAGATPTSRLAQSNLSNPPRQPLAHMEHQNRDLEKRSRDQQDEDLEVPSPPKKKHAKDSPKDGSECSSLRPAGVDPSLGNTAEELPPCPPGGDPKMWQELEPCQRPAYTEWLDRGGREWLGARRAEAA